MKSWFKDFDMQSQDPDSLILILYVLTRAVMHKPGLYFTNVAGSQHKLRLTAKGVRVAERMFFLAGSNRSAAPFESQSPAAVDKNQVPVAPSAPVKKRPKKDNVVKHLESPKQVIPSSGRNLPDWMTKAKKRPRVTSSNTTGTGAICDRNVVRKLFLDEIKGEVKGEAKHEVKKEVKVEKQEEKLSEWARPAVRAAVSGKMGLGNTMRYATVKEEKDVVKSKFDLEDAVASRMGQPFQVHIKNVQVKKEVT